MRKSSHPARTRSSRRSRRPPSRSGSSSSGVKSEKAREVYVPTDAGLGLALRGLNLIREPAHDWRVVLDAYTGEVLEARPTDGGTRRPRADFDPSPVVTSNDSTLRDPASTLAGCGFAGSRRRRSTPTRFRALCLTSRWQKEFTSSTVRTSRSLTSTHPRPRSARKPRRRISATRATTSGSRPSTSTTSSMRARMGNLRLTCLGGDLENRCPRLRLFPESSVSGAADSLGPPAEGRKGSKPG